MNPHTYATWEEHSENFISYWHLLIIPMLFPHYAPVRIWGLFQHLPHLHLPEPNQSPSLVGSALVKSLPKWVFLRYMSDCVTLSAYSVPKDHHSQQGTHHCPSLPHSCSHRSSPSCVYINCPASGSRPFLSTWKSVSIVVRNTGSRFKSDTTFQDMCSWKSYLTSLSLANKLGI